jgi:hypothetical protein
MQIGRLIMVEMTPLTIDLHKQVRDSLTKSICRTMLTIILHEFSYFNDFSYNTICQKLKGELIWTLHCVWAQSGPETACNWAIDSMKDRHFLQLTINNELFTERIIRLSRQIFIISQSHWSRPRSAIFLLLLDRKWRYSKSSGRLIAKVSGSIVYKWRV